MSRVRVPSHLIRGDVDVGFGPVADAFSDNFSSRREVGAACAVYLAGRKVIDLWGGYRDGHTAAPWEPDTMVVVFSASKGMASAAMAVAHSRGLFDWDRPVAHYWPDFGQNGKAGITVRQLMSHQAGLPYLDAKPNLEHARDREWLSASLAAQRPAWEPGTRHGYHAITLGWYQSELLRRTDPGGRSIGPFFNDEIALPLGADFYFGIPPRIPDERLATIHAFRRPQMIFNLDKMPRRMLLSFLNPRGTTARAMTALPEIVKPDMLTRRKSLEAEVPSVLGVGEPRAMALVYGELAQGGPSLDMKQDTIRALEEPAPAPSGALDQVLRMQTSFSMGFVKPFPEFTFGSSSRSYGAPGGGGSFGMADPELGLGYAYGMNRMGFYTPVDPRELTLRKAVYEVLGARPQGQQHIL